MELKSMRFWSPTPQLHYENKSQMQEHQDILIIQIRKYYRLSILLRINLQKEISEN